VPLAPPLPSTELSDPFPANVETLPDGSVTRMRPSPRQPKVVVSGKLVTGQNPASAKGVAEAVVGLL